MQSSQINFKHICSKVEMIYNRLAVLKEKMASFKHMDLKLNEIRKEIDHTEERLYKVQMFALEEIKGVSVLLLKIIQKNVPDAPILDEFFDLLEQDDS